MGRWKLRHTNEDAKLEIAFLFQSDDVKDEIRRILSILIAQDDPRSPNPSSGLIVDEIEYDSPGWFRVKIPRYGIRIVFRLLIVRDEKIIEVGPLSPVDQDATERYLDIVQAAYRKDAYGAELRRRYRHLRDDNLFSG
jgi:hypothetical protein